MNKQQGQRLQEAIGILAKWVASRCNFVFEALDEDTRELFGDDAKELLTLRDSAGKHIIGVIDSEQTLPSSPYEEPNYSTDTRLCSKVWDDAQRGMIKEGWRKVILPEEELNGQVKKGRRCPNKLPKNQRVVYLLF